MKMKILAISILFALVFCALSCSSPDEGSGKGGEKSGVGETEDKKPEETTIERLTADVPADMKLGGRDFTICYSDHPIDIAKEYDIYASEEDGTLINDAVYLRNRRLEAQFDMNIKEYVTPYGGVPGELGKRVKAGDDTFDAVTIYLNQVGTPASSGWFYDYAHMPYIDLKKPWWDPASVEAYSIANRLFAACSDMTTLDKGMTGGMIFNKQMIQDHQLPNPYTLVDTGEWTLDKLYDMSKNIAMDLDGNGKYDDNDRYGVIYCRDAVMSIFNGCGETVAKKDENDIPYITVMTEKTASIITNLFDFLYDTKNCFHSAKYFDPLPESYVDGQTRMFQEGKALFVAIFMIEVENLRNMETDFGILPMPKYDKAQQKYYCNVNPYTGVAIVFPTTIRSAEESGAVVEALSCDSKYTLQPTYIDVLLKTKNARDEESQSMLELMFDNRIYDIGDIYQFGGIATELIFMTMRYDKNFVSMCEKRQNTAAKDIDRLVKKITELP